MRSKLAETSRAGAFTTPSRAHGRYGNLLLGLAAVE